MTTQPHAEPETTQLATLTAEAVEDLSPREESDDVVGGITAVEKPLLPAV
jgi:hypothetical protein